MKAYDANLLDLLKKSHQFVVPIYQRVYSWDKKECKRLWDDILQVGQQGITREHFTGAIVYVKQGEGTLTSAEANLLIDGQQRVTTVMIMLAALAKTLQSIPAEQQEPVEGFSPKKIRNRYLTNPDEDGDKFFKLILSKADEPALKSVINQAPASDNHQSRVLNNYGLFLSWMSESEADLKQVCLGLRKLMVVDVSLTLGVDDPQMVFETMNSTGKKLSQADLIRNFMLMDLSNRAQVRLYEDYWFPMEQLFRGDNENRFDEFVRHYLTLKTGNIPRLADIYEAFKEYANYALETGITREDLVIDLFGYSRWFSAMAMGREQNAKLRGAFEDIERLKATVVYPFLLRLYADYSVDRITPNEFHALLTLVISYLLRRAICQIPTNSHNKTFVSLAQVSTPANYVESFTARFLLMGTYTRFPDDAEFKHSLKEVDLYSFKRKGYFFRELENFGRKEEVSIADYTVEHIMPQNTNLSPSWREALGDNWKNVQEKYLHTLGNLTLTGYNPEYSDRPFTEKRDIKGGFHESPLRLNQGLGQLETWNETTILERADKLSETALEIWQRPHLEDEKLAAYRDQFNDRSRFDWTTTHHILENLPAGNWTTYFQLAEAADTSAQPMASHVARCPICVNAYRVLTWEGKISAGFKWTDPEDTRNPRALLEEEGIRFTNDEADSSQRLDSQDLLALLEDEEGLM